MVMKHLTIRNRAISILDDFFKSNRTLKKFLLPSNICYVVPLVLKKNNIHFKFIDISKKDLNMDKNQIIKNIKKYNGMIWFNTYGNEEKNTNFFKECKLLNKDFVIINDKCLNEPQIKKSKNCFSDMELYSTGYSKYCDLGYGGFSISKEKIKFHNTKFLEDDFNKISINIKNSIVSKKKIIDISNNWLKKELIKDEGNYFSKIKKSIKKIKLHKSRINQIYDEIIPNEVKLGKKFNLWRYNIYISKNEKLLKTIFENNLFASNHYYPSSKIFKSEKKKITDLLHNNVINLFNDFRYSEDMAEKTAKLVRNHFLMFGTKNFYE